MRIGKLGVSGRRCGPWRGHQTWPGNQRPQGCEAVACKRHP